MSLPLPCRSWRQRGDARPSRCSAPKPIFYFDTTNFSSKKSTCSRPELAKPIYLQSSRTPLPPSPSPRYGSDAYTQDPHFYNSQLEGEYSSGDGDQVFCSDSDDNSDDDSDSGDDFFFPRHSHNPRMRRRMTKRATFEEAQKRRLGLLFPLESDSIEEQHALRRDGKLARYHDLVAPDPNVYNARRPRKKPAMQVRHQAKYKFGVSAAAPSPSCSSSTLSFHSSSPSDVFDLSASAVSTAPSSTLASPPCKTTFLVPSLSHFTPVPESECPLFQFSLALKIEAEYRAQQECDRIAQAEEDAFRTASQLANSHTNIKKAAAHARRRHTAERTLFEKLSSPSSVLSKTLKNRFLDRANEHHTSLSAPVRPSFTSAPARPYGARAPSSLVTRTFPEVFHPAPSSEPCRAIIECETYIRRPRLKPPMSSLRPRMSCRQSRSRSRSRARAWCRSGRWGDRDEDEDDDDFYGRPPSDDEVRDGDDLDNIQDADGYNNEYEDDGEDDDEDDGHLPIQRVPHSQHYHRSIIVQDSQFFRVYAVEMATRVKYGGYSSTRAHIPQVQQQRWLCTGGPGWRSDAFFRVVKHNKEACVACGGVGLERWRKRRIGSALRIECAKA